MHTGVHQRSPVAEKIALFRSPFKGREDVYSRRFESRKTGRAGYAPACGNEWVRGIFEKPRIKCPDCSHRAFLPVTDEVIRMHLSGKDTSDQKTASSSSPSSPKTSANIWTPPLMLSSVPCFI